MISCEDRQRIDCTVSYFAGALFAMFLRESTCLPLRVTDIRIDPPDGFFLDLASGTALRVSVANVSRPRAPA